MRGHGWVVGDILQIDPDHDEVFGGCLMIVTQVANWGAQGFFDVPGQGQAFYRVEPEHAEKVGRVVWFPDSEEEDG